MCEEGSLTASVGGIMSNTVEVSLDELDAGASALDGCATGLCAVAVHEAAHDVPRLLPGSETAGAVTEFAARFTAAVALTSDRLAELARLTRECAANYRAADEGASQGFLPLLGP